MWCNAEYAPIDIVFEDSYASYSLPAWERLGQRSKDWIFEKGTCGDCKEKFSSDKPHCKCAEITKVEFPEHCVSEDYLGGIYPYERRRMHSKYTAEDYKKKKDKAEGNHTKKDIEAIYELQEGLCYYCLTKITYNKPKRNFDADHIKPLAQGGTNWPDNIAAACRKCNQSKGGMGGLAFWNKIEKKYGSDLIFRAKNLAREQRLERKEISKNRKLEIQKRIKKKLYLKDSYPQVEEIAEQYKKLKDFQKECPFTSAYTLVMKGICTEFSSDVFGCSYEEIKKDNQFVFYSFSIAVAATLYSFLKLDYEGEAYFSKIFNLENLISEFYLIAPFNDVQKIKAKKLRLNKAIKQEIQNSDLSPYILSFLENPSLENRASMFAEAQRLFV